MARPSKLTPEVRDKIVQAIRAGNFVATAAVYAGIDVSSVYRWMAEGQQANSGAKREFYDAVTVARAEMEVRVVANVMRTVQGGYVTARRTRILRDGTEQVEEDVAGPNGTLGLKVLERAFPSRWHSTQQVELSGPDGGPVQIETGDTERGLAARLTAFIAERQGEPAELERVPSERLDGPAE
jgi:hypothetical protein